MEKLFKENPPQRVIVFSSSKLKVKELARSLKKMKIKVAEMHSDLGQTDREEVMLRFKAGKINVLVATDIISRGIDIDNIETVINYDVPHEAEDYVHRIGRTARADRDGCAYTFISDKERGKFRQIEKLLEKEVEKLPVDEELGLLRIIVKILPQKGAEEGRPEEMERGMETEEKEHVRFLITRKRIKLSQKTDIGGLSGNHP